MLFGVVVIRNRFQLCAIGSDHRCPFLYTIFSLSISQSLISNFLMLIYKATFSWSSCIWLIDWPNASESIVVTISEYNRNNLNFFLIPNLNAHAVLRQHTNFCKEIEKFSANSFSSGSFSQLDWENFTNPVVQTEILKQYDNKIQQTMNNLHLFVLIREACTIKSCHFDFQKMGHMRNDTYNGYNRSSPIKNSATLRKLPAVLKPAIYVPDIVRENAIY